MRKLGRTDKAKTVVATIAVASIVMVASTVAQADYSYTFTVFNTVTSPGGADIGPSFGSFTTSDIPNATNVYTITSGSYTFNLGGMTYSSSGGLSSINSGGSFSFPGSNSDTSLNLQSVGMVNYTSNTISGRVGNFAIADGAFGTGSGSFMATLAASSGGGGGSGGAPTPEVNAGLGILIAGASFAFLRRKRGGRHEMTAA